MSEAPELLPCPFCRSGITHTESLARSFQPPRLYHEYQHPRNECVALHGQMWQFSDDPEPRLKFIKAWNRRAALTVGAEATTSATLRELRQVIFDALDLSEELRIECTADVVAALTEAGFVAVTPSAEPSEQKLIDIANVVEGRLEDRLAKVLGVKQYPSTSSLDFDELLEIVEDRLARVAEPSEQKEMPTMAERVTEAMTANWVLGVDDLIQSISEGDDRTAPEDYPNHLLITAGELKEFARDVFALTAALQHPQADLRVETEGWRPITEADSSIATVQTFGEVTLRNSHPVWVRDADGRVYEAVWTDHKQGYWWDIEGESPVDPVEYYPHPLATSPSVDHAKDNAEKLLLAARKIAKQHGGYGVDSIGFLELVDAIVALATSPSAMGGKR